MRQIGKLGWVALFALAMAYVEAASVVYLRRIYGITDLIRDVAPYDRALSPVELGREAATLVMLAAVGWAVGRTWPSRAGFAFFAFGAWDIFYYVWLRLLIGWPASLLDPDILFLIPLPWWGPVLSPILIALLAVAGGAAAIAREDRGRAIRLGIPEWASLGLGALAVLYAFMADAIAILPASAEALSDLRPTPFKWPIYLAGLALMTWGVFRATRTRPTRR
jgi:hypothetical protein